MIFSSKDKIKIQEYVTERAYPVSTVILITLISFMWVYLSCLKFPFTNDYYVIWILALLYM